MFNRHIVAAALGLAALILPESALAGGVKCYTFQRGKGAEVADAYIAGHEPTESHGSGNYLFVGGAAFSEMIALLWFDLAGVPSSAEVTSAVVTLHEEGSSAPAKLFVHRVTAPWGEDDASWQSCGGAFDPAVEAEIESGEVGPVSFDVSALVQEWVDGTQPNDGLLIAQARGARTTLSSSEQKDVARRPRLDVCFAVPPDQVMPDESSAAERSLDVGDELGVFGLDG